LQRRRATSWGVKRAVVHEIHLTAIQVSCKPFSDTVNNNPKLLIILQYHSFHRSCHLFGAHPIVAITPVLSRHPVKAHTTIAFLTSNAHVIRSVILWSWPHSIEVQKDDITLSKEDGPLLLYKYSFYQEFH